MTRDDIARMAREVGLTDPDLGDFMTDYGYSEDAICKLVALVAAAERESILDLVNDHAKNNTDLIGAIRARGQDSMPLFSDWNVEWK
mgnify:CR=1 FL=1